MTLSQPTLSLVLLGAAAIGPVRMSAGDCLYDITIIAGPPCQPGGSPVTLNDISESGSVVGYYTPCAIGDETAFVWSPETGMMVLSFPPGSVSEATGMQSLTEFVGWFAAPNEDGLGNIAFAADGTGMHVLGTLPGGNWSEAEAIHDGVVVGWWGNTVTGIPATPQAFRWHDGVMTSLTEDLGTLKSDAQDINARGQITGSRGSSWYQNGSAYVWQDGVVVTIPKANEWVWSTGKALNDRGDVAGYGRRPNPSTGAIEDRGFVWINGEAVVVAPLAGQLRSWCADINDRRQVVGKSWDIPSNQNFSRAFVWHNGVASDLNSLIAPDAAVVIYDAWGINNAGQIAARGFSTKYFALVGMRLTPHAPPVGDMDGDCRVGIVDFLDLLSAWGACPAGCAADLDGDGTVGGADFQVLLANWS